MNLWCHRRQITTKLRYNLYSIHSHAISLHSHVTNWQKKNAQGDIKHIYQATDLFLAFIFSSLILLFVLNFCFLRNFSRVSISVDVIHIVSHTHQIRSNLFWTSSTNAICFINRSSTHTQTGWPQNIYIYLNHHFIDYYYALDIYTQKAPRRLYNQKVRGNYLIIWTLLSMVDPRTL